MELVVKEAATIIKDSIAFLSKISVDVKFRGEKDGLISGLQKALKSCEKVTTIHGKAAVQGQQNPRNLSDDIYDDAETADEVYDDTEANDAVYDDTEVEDKSRFPAPPPPSKISSKGSLSSLSSVSPSVVACEELTGARMFSFLEVKREKSNFSLTGAWQKRWCVFNDNIFYMYESSKDKKQKDAFHVSGYKFEARDDVTKESKRKGRCFVARNDRISKTYEFCASDRESVENWLKCSPEPAPDASGSVSDGDVYDDVDQPQVASQPAPSDDVYDDTEVNDDIYEDTAEEVSAAVMEGNLQLKKAVVGLLGKSVKRWCILERPSMLYVCENSKEKKPKDGISLATFTLDAQEGGRKLLLKNPDKSKTLEFTASDSDTWSKWKHALESQLPSVVGKSPGRPAIPALKPPVAADDVHDDTEDGDGDIYDEVEMDTVSRPASVGSRALPSAPDVMPPPGTTRMLPPTRTPKSQSPSLPTPPAINPSANLPPLPPMSEQKYTEDAHIDDSICKSEEPSDKDEVDYSAIYQGMWDCAADDENELAFRRGDLMQILSKEFDSVGWWIAKKDSVVGLIPKNFVMEAYEI